MLNFFALTAFTMMLAIGQVLFKHLGVSIHGLPAQNALVAVLFRPMFYASLAIYGLATLLWIWILSRVPLSQAYPWMGVTVLAVVVLGWWQFGERPSPIFWLGLAFVVMGVVLTQYGSTTNT